MDFASQHTPGRTVLFVFQFGEVKTGARGALATRAIGGSSVELIAFNSAQIENDVLKQTVPDRTGALREPKVK